MPRRETATLSALEFGDSLYTMLTLFLLNKTDFFANTGFMYMFGRNGALIWAVGPSLIAAGLFFGGRFMRVQPMKWVAMLVAVIGIVLGVSAVMSLQSQLYVSYNDVYARQKLVHYATLGIPIVTLLGLMVFEFLGKRQFEGRL